MSLTSLLGLLVISILVGRVAHTKWRLYLLLVVSAGAVYALQPELPIRYLDFWLPTCTLGIAVLGWILTTASEKRNWKANWPALAVLISIFLGLGLTRFSGLDLPLTASRPPAFEKIIIALAVTTLLAGLLAKTTSASKGVVTSAVVLLLIIFAGLKIPGVTEAISQALRSLNQQSTALASSFDIRWLGFSYIAFRLIHTLRDRQAGRLPDVSLAEYIVYLVFFPALVAGPIDRIERFIGDLRKPKEENPGDVFEAGRRILLGLFKKFVIADTLGLIALNGVNATQVQTPLWAWVLLYAYSLQIYFDFSGYTDMAIGMGNFLGIRLPENFSAPYRKPNLTLFWNNWHMTLTQWFRAYYFNPLTRALRSQLKQASIPGIIFVTQISTMVLIGLWHGVTWNFMLWGLWHGLGLFIHNRWSEWTRPWAASVPARMQSGLKVSGILITFNFVALGWALFALPSLDATWSFVQVLFGVGL
ncbi:MAG: MBOAT family O-acyltransferase [Chloroflexota bacterium]